MDLPVFWVLLPWSIVGLGCWIGYHLVRQNGRILLRLEALEHQLTHLQAAPVRGTVPRIAPSQPLGLPIGAVAPLFTLRDLAGAQQALAQWRGQRLLLIFFNPLCGFCQQMVPDLAALPTDGANGRPLPVVVTAGEADANRALVTTHGLRCPVLLQEQREVASQYGAQGTPMGYLIDEQGRIASALTVGAQALLALASAPQLEGVHAPARHNSHKSYKGNRSLSNSRLNRNGLQVGTLAPPFTLPRLEGGTLSLEAYRGQRVLLVFSDPHCGPCDALLPQLERRQQRLPDVQVLLISRGDVAENRRKVQHHQLTLPVVLQRTWEISRLYAMFGTPVGYLIDTQGTIAADVAVGAEAILALLSGTLVPTNGQSPQATPHI